jgi:hypothetical protein
MAFPYLLLATQAAGIGLNLYANKQQNKIEGLGYKLEEGQLNLRMQQELLVASQQQLGDLTRLQENMATQRAVFAARGTNAGQGSARTIMEASGRAYREDERARKLNTDFRRNYIDSLKRLQRIEHAGLKSNRAAKQLQSGLNMFSFNEIFGGNKMPEKTVSKNL